MEFENCEGPANENPLAFEKVNVPKSEGQLKRDPVQETLEEPLESVEARVDAVLVKVLLEPRQHFLQHFVMMSLEPGKFWESMHKKSCKEEISQNIHSGS